MLLDSASLYFRAYYGVPDSLRSPQGEPVNAVRGLLDFIARLVQDHRPDQLVACMDADWRPQWRVDLVPSYKTHRVAEAAVDGEEEVPDTLAPQVPVIEQVLDALGIARVGSPGYEADDVIGTLTARAEGPVQIVTGDRDLFQLVDDARGITVLYPVKGMGNLQVTDDALLLEKYGVRGARYADMAALRGDPSDGLPGVKGIGEKTAAQLINEYGDLPAIRAAALDIRSKLTPAHAAQHRRGRGLPGRRPDRGPGRRRRAAAALRPGPAARAAGPDDPGGALRPLGPRHLPGARPGRPRGALTPRQHEGARRR